MASVSPDTGRKPLGINLPKVGPSEAPPGIAALFVIRFDIKAGYVVSWKRTLPDVEIEGVVEYKSLPSGLHHVSNDLVYFVHEQYAGISAFINRPAEETERNARMVAIGVLVPLTFGRLGKSWRHAPRLKELVETYAQDMSNVKALSEYWESYRIRETGTAAVPDSPLDSPIGVRSRPWRDRPEVLRRSRAFSDALMIEAPKPALTPFHPASSLPGFLDTFGPLVFPLYRAALLRKRILLMAEAPVHEPCNYVYDLSLLASVPQSLLPLLPADELPPLRPRPLFNVGIHDIPYLSTFNSPTRIPAEDPSWIACTTDSVLGMKTDLYDVMVTLPAPYSKDAADKTYPKISIFNDPRMMKPGNTRNSFQGAQLKATQRDARRFITLQKGLRHLSREQPLAHHQNNDNSDGDRDGDGDDTSDAASTFSSSSIIEPLSWARLAYTSFIWWASAGEKREGLTDEEEEEQMEQDARLLASIESLYPVSAPGRRGGPEAASQHSNTDETDARQPPEIALVAYFRRWTSQIFMVLADAIARHDGDGDRGGDGHDESENDGLRLSGNESPISQPYRDDDDDEEEEAEAEHDTEQEREPSLVQGADEDDDDHTPLLRSEPGPKDKDETRLRPGGPHRVAHVGGADGDGDGDDDDDEPVRITAADMVEMGLDVWSATDRVFVEEMVLLWWGRRAYVDAARIRCCGIPIF